MPPKGKAAPKPKGSEANKPSSTSTSAPPPPASTTSTPSSVPSTSPSTVSERSQQRFDESRPNEAAREKSGLSSLAPAEQVAWISSQFARSSAARARLGTKAQRELWRHVNEASLPVRAPKTKPSPGSWGKDRAGQHIGGYTPARFDDRAAKRITLTALEIASRAFKDTRERARKGLLDPLSKEPVVLAENEIDQEKNRRRQMAALRRELYGQTMGQFEQDPEWDDVVPIPQDEPEMALAAIAYPASYAEAISYLRAVMQKKEYSPRCLRLTEHIISMNPAHYTVWLYRASNIFAMKLLIPDEIEWLNEVALEHLKNYQIWHHRHLLVDNYYPSIADDADKVSQFAASERAFLAAILAHDTKNYHVWSYRSYLVGKLGTWGADELAAVEAMITDDVRNNSAWSHRFFLVFSNPAHSTPGTAATDPDPAVPRDIVDRELQYAMVKTYLAPQNQSPWNYLKGVLAKGGRRLASVEAFAAEFVAGLGEGEEVEQVRSTHALDLLAEIYAEKREKEKADLALRRLAEKWDRIRVGYWEWRRKCLDVEG
ncbi:hypothetical protein B0T19DRAFT_441591 [Cercophora scortea]|uniref:Protein farnesyltransferase/geranylgeranyltransferase type-1 subunit alpha n=1 Tax=Cercophora scortea TaxID=314031 RepID=A0AAE0IMQ0_9PEZI|nr:hypothetical protein B0T19DRAFT_441591 [Cercophora scortea]